MSIPDPIQHTSDRVLEFDHLRELLAVYAASPLGQRRIAALAPSHDRHWIERQQQLTEELRGYLQPADASTSTACSIPRRCINKSRIQGAALELTEIRDVLLLADRAAEWREIALHPPVAIEAKWEAVRELSQQHRRLHPVAALLPQQDPARRNARRPRLAGAGAHSPRHRAPAAHHPANRCSPTCEGCPTAAPCRTSSSPFAASASSFRSRWSSGGGCRAWRTARPPAGRRCSWSRWRPSSRTTSWCACIDEEQGEIHRILLEMTARIGEQAEALAAAVEILGELELQFAKARFAQDYDCVAVKLLGGEPTLNRRRRRCVRPAQCAASAAGAHPQAQRRRRGSAHG